MSLLKLAMMGHPILRQEATPVHKGSHLNPLIEDMVETMDDALGRGLAAPQVHVSLQVIIYYVTAHHGQRPSLEDIPLTVLVNPEVVPLGEETFYDWEGCLSLPGLVGFVPRYQRIRVSALDGEGHPLHMECEGFHARVIQHEVDHLKGILYPQRMDDLSLLMFSKEWHRDVPQKAQELLHEQRKEV